MDRKNAKGWISVCVGTALMAAVPGMVTARDWGARPVAQKYRPGRAWIGRFHDKADVVAHGSISKAIDACDAIVGKHGFCTVRIEEDAELPVEIFRSNTRLVGVEGMKALQSPKNGAFIYIGDRTRHVVIENLRLEGHRAGKKDIYGIIVEGKRIKDIVIRGNEIFGFESDSNAHAVAVYGTGANGKESIARVIIEKNTIHDMKTGSSESIAINGNVQRWEILGNDIYDINNIAIDAIGGEGTAPTRKRKGRTLPGKFDAARFGFIEDNYVENMHTKNNPAYGRRESWAAAIYIDGAHDILVRGNVVVDSAWAYEVGAENCVVTRNITMVDNSASQSYYGDFVLGGYAHKGFWGDRSIDCDPRSSEDRSEGHGYVRYLTVHENSFDSDGTKEERILPQFRVTHTILAEPGVEPVNADGDGRAKGDANAIRTDDPQEEGSLKRGGER